MDKGVIDLIVDIDSHNIFKIYIFFYLSSCGGVDGLIVTLGL